MTNEMLLVMTATHNLYYRGRERENKSVSF